MDIFSLDMILLRNIVFYTIAGGAIALMAQATGASLPVVLLSSLLVPPLLLLILAILCYKGIIG